MTLLAAWANWFYGGTGRRAGCRCSRTIATSTTSASSKPPRRASVRRMAQLRRLHRQAGRGNPRTAQGGRAVAYPDYARPAAMACAAQQAGVRHAVAAPSGRIRPQRGAPGTEDGRRARQPAGPGWASFDGDGTANDWGTGGAAQDVQTDRWHVSCIESLAHSYKRRPDHVRATVSASLTPGLGWQASSVETCPTEPCSSALAAQAVNRFLLAHAAKSVAQPAVGAPEIASSPAIRRHAHAGHRTQPSTRGRARTRTHAVAHLDGLGRTRRGRRADQPEQRQPRSEQQVRKAPALKPPPASRAMEIRLSRMPTGASETESDTAKAQHAPTTRRRGGSCRSAGSDCRPARGNDDGTAVKPTCLRVTGAGKSFRMLACWTKSDAGSS